MGRRTYCDLCGCTISNNVTCDMAFGSWPTYATQSIPQQMYTIAGGGGGGVGGALGGISYPAPSLDLSPLIKIELCKHCVPIWLERVRAICCRSDPNEKSDDSAAA